MLFGPAIRNMQVRYFIDHDPDYRKTVFIAGMGRSGTTWLGELINYRNDFRLMFEPFDPARVAMAAGFREHLYLRETDERRIFLAPADAIVRGHVREHFVDQHNRKLICGRRIVKEVHANLVLRWLYRRFPGMPILLIVRHPLAVAASRLATDEDVDLEADFLSQPQLVDDFLRPFTAVLRSCATPFERHIAAWCVETGVPLSQFQAGEISIVAYEQLAVEPERTLRSVFSAIGLPFDPKVLAFTARPSRTTLSPDKLRGQWEAGPRRIVEAWRDRLPPAQVDRAQEIMSAFGMQHLYADPVPDPATWLPFRLGDGKASQTDGRLAAGGA